MINVDINVFFSLFPALVCIEFIEEVECTVIQRLLEQDVHVRWLWKSRCKRKDFFSLNFGGKMMPKM